MTASLVMDLDPAHFEQLKRRAIKRGVAPEMEAVNVVMAALDLESSALPGELSPTGMDFKEHLLSLGDFGMELNIDRRDSPPSSRQVEL